MKPHDHVEPLANGYLLTGEVALDIERSPDYVRWLERHGHLPAVKTNRGVRLFRRQDVDAYRERRDRQRDARHQQQMSHERSRDAARAARVRS